MMHSIVYAEIQKEDCGTGRHRLSAHAWNSPTDRVQASAKTTPSLFLCEFRSNFRTAHSAAHLETTSSVEDL